jgi:hypothetical protein
LLVIEINESSQLTKHRQEIHMSKTLTTIISLDALTTVTGGNMLDDLWQRAGTADNESRQVAREETCNWANLLRPGSCDPKSDTSNGYVTSDLGSYGSNAAGAFWAGQ